MECAHQYSTEHLPILCLPCCFRLEQKSLLRCASDVVGARAGRGLLGAEAWAGPASPLRKLTLRGQRLSLSHPQTEPVRGPQHLPPCVSGPWVPRLPAPLRSGPSYAARGANPTCTLCPSALPPRAGALASGSRGAGRKQDDAGGHPLPGALQTELLEGGLCPPAWPQGQVTPRPGHLPSSHPAVGQGSSGKSHRWVLQVGAG